MLEQCTGRTYAEYVTAEVLTRSEMANSGYDRAEILLPRRALGYSLAESGLRNAAYGNMDWCHAAGGLYTTPEDLCRFLKALPGATLLSESSRTAMRKPWVRTGENDAHYGYGTISETIFGHRRLGHTGAVFGFQCYAFHYPDDDLTVVICCNIENTGAGLIDRDVAAILFDQPYSLPEARQYVTVDPAMLARYQGTYMSRWFGRPVPLKVALDGDQLTMEVPLLGRAKMRAVAENHFFVTMKGEVEITFALDAAGRATAMDANWSGEKMMCARTA